MRAGGNLNVPISPHTLALLRQLAADSNESIQAILDAALEVDRREKFLRGANADYAKLKRSPKAWRKELGERQMWDRTLKDGFDN